MKPSFFPLVLSCLLSGSLSSQEFAPLGAKWHFGETYAWSPDIGFITYESIGDTLFHQWSCRVVIKSNGTCCIPGGVHYLHQRGDSIFVYNPATDTINLIIDFGAEAGEQWTLQTNPIGNLHSDTATCTVDSVSYFHYSPTDSLRILHVVLSATVYDSILGETMQYRMTNQIIEHVGYRNALLPSDCIWFCDVNFDGMARCYEDPVLGFIGLSAVDCEYTPVEEIVSADDIVVRPNPASDRIWIDAPGVVVDNILLFSLDGSIILESKSAFMDVRAIDPGLYVIRTRVGDHWMTRKIAILR